VDLVGSPVNGVVVGPDGAAYQTTVPSSPCM
jgi:hypothetical protein